ncbi:hypothetical protein F4802DRAFT_553236 [Xylaria palmicola]|nr:hypothetical protein F4802DRAFT_553236 [Xylaria palmicola]
MLVLFYFYLYFDILFLHCCVVLCYVRTGIPVHFVIPVSVLSRPRCIPDDATEMRGLIYLPGWQGSSRVTRRCRCPRFATFRPPARLSARVCAIYFYINYKGPCT